MTVQEIVEKASRLNLGGENRLQSGEWKFGLDFDFHALGNGSYR